VRWRKRIGPKQMEQLLAETLETAKRGEHLNEQHMERVNVDTTVQEKAIAYPTDARLQHKARVLLVKAAKNRLCSCPADAAGESRTEEGQELPGAHLSQHSAQLPAAR
jgi:hypothetical protein